MPGDYPPRDPDGSRLRRPGENRFGQSQPGASRWQAPQPPANRPGASGGAWRQPPGAPGRSSGANVYRPYSSAARTAMPPGGPRVSGQWGAVDPFGASAPGAGLTSAHMEAIHRRRLGFALFHDGNVGHLWRGEVASLLGEGALSVGVIIWLVALTSSPLAVLAALLALGLPLLLVAPLGATFENVAEPGRLLTWVGRVRVFAALGIIGMHFLTVYPLLYLLLFVIGMSGRFRQALRVAATRACLAPGELELVTNDLYVGSAVATVAGPLLGSVLFLALGDRIILVAAAAALFFLLAGNSDGMLDALPEAQRGFLQATPATVAPDDATREELLAAARDEQTASAGDEEGEDEADAPLTPEQTELALPEWYQQGPQNPAQAIGDIRVGLALAGGRSASATALLALVALALAGGGLAALEVFYLGDRLNLPPLYLGVLVALEASGLTLGTMLASLLGLRALGPRLTLIGLALTGAALAVFGAAPIAGIAFAAALGMGMANALAITGAHAALRVGRDGAERRAISAAESFVTALASLFGALLFTVAYVAPSRFHIGKLALVAQPTSLLFTIAGAGLTLGAVILFVVPGLRDKAPRPEKLPIHATYGRIPGVMDPQANPSASMVGALWDNADDDDMGDDEYDERGYTGEYDARYDESDEWDEPPPRGGHGGGRGGRGGRR